MIFSTYIGGEGGQKYALAWYLVLTLSALPEFTQGRPQKKNKKDLGFTWYPILNNVCIEFTKLFEDYNWMGMILKFI